MDTGIVTIPEGQETNMRKGLSEYRSRVHLSVENAANVGNYAQQDCNFSIKYMILPVIFWEDWNTLRLQSVYIHCVDQ